MANDTQTPKPLWPFSFDWQTEKNASFFQSSGIELQSWAAVGYERM